MRKIDFLILYEHKERELENACLLKVNLEKRGYIVKIKSIYSFIQHMYIPKVIIVPHLYNNYQVYAFICKYKKRKCRVINLQYEQVLSDEDIKTGYSKPKDDAKKAILFAWGEKEASRYSKDSEQKVVITGNLALDFNLPKYKDYFKSRKEICNIYHIDETKKIILFISSFSLANVDDHYLALHFPASFSQMKAFSSVSRDSKKVLLEWLIKYLDKHENVVIIYRPHPAENDAIDIEALQEKNDRFKVIRDFSIRQWIRTADCLTTWFSTSIIDAYYAERACVVIRPFKLPEISDVPFLKTARIISSYDSLEDSIKNLSSAFPVSEEKIKEYCSNEIGIPQTEKIINLCEAVLNSNDLVYTFSPSNEYKLNLFKKIHNLIRDIIFDIQVYINLSGVLRFFTKQNNLKRNAVLLAQRDLFKSNVLIKEYCERLKKIDE